MYLSDLAVSRFCDVASDFIKEDSIDQTVLYSIFGLCCILINIVRYVKKQDI